MPHNRLNELCEKIKKPTALAIIKQVREEIEAKMQHATELATKRKTQLVVAAETRMREELDAELRRLEKLREVNPSIRQEELDHVSFQIAECSLHIQHASLQLQALRLIITT